MRGNTEVSGSLSRQFIKKKDCSDFTRAALFHKLVRNFDPGVIHSAINMPLYDLVIRTLMKNEVDPDAKPDLWKTIVASNVGKCSLGLTQSAPA